MKSALWTLLCFVARCIGAPVVFLVVATITGWSVTWSYVFRRETADEQPPEHDQTEVAPDEEDDRGRRETMRLVPEDMTIFDQNKAGYTAFLRDSAECTPNPVPLDLWYARRIARRAGR